MHSCWGGVHKDLINKINPKKEIFIANGVGIPNIFYSHTNKAKYTPKHNEFLYIGRIAKEKNIDLLIKVFCDSDFKLNIIGGKLDREYENIKSLDYIDNKNLPQIIQNHIALILPSKSETWGLVVEESLLCGVCVIVSSNVGCGSELVSQYKSGIIFENDNLEELQKALLEASKDYKTLSQNALLIDFENRYKNMQKAYCLER